MKKFWNRLLKIVKWIMVVLIGMVVLFFIVRNAGRAFHNRTPRGGVNESMYVEINGTKQWINIYGRDKNNPVLLYLHGGPGEATSCYDYAFTRKWADVYTVVTWDQRNCGKSYDASQNDTELTYEMMMRDGLEMTRYLCGYLDVEKISLLGHSWGSYLGGNLVLAYPEYYDCYIGTGQLVDPRKNELTFKQIAKEWVGDDEEGQEYLNALTPNHMGPEHWAAKNRLMEKYGYGVFRDGMDYNIVLTVLFNPHYSLWDYWKFLKSDFSAYRDFVASNEFKKFSLSGRTEYSVPYYNINGDNDYQTNYFLAQEYFDAVQAPRKKMYIMENTTHGLLESKSEDFSVILHEIAEEERQANAEGDE